MFDGEVAERLADEENEVAEMEELDSDALACDEDDVKVIEVAEPSFDPILNRLIALVPEQQLRLCRARSTSDISQHINPPSAAQLFEHCHAAGPNLL